MSSEHKRPTAVDLFCGSGGISCGLTRAGFHVLAGVDSDAAAMQTFRANFAEAFAPVRDLTQREPDALREELGLLRGALDILAGGPPCQGFSKNVPRARRFAEDPKNLLVATFLRYVEAFRPRFVLLENVAEMRAGFDGAYTEMLVSALQSKHLGYTVTHAVLFAPDYGVPQRRRRAFFVAARDGDVALFPTPTHRAEAKDGLFDAQGHVSVWDAISDLPVLEHGEGNEPAQYACDPQSAFQQWARGSEMQVCNHVARRLQEKQHERLRALRPGEGLKDLPEALRPKSGYSGAYGRLTKEMVAPTITRWVFHPGSGRFGHPVQARVISIREAARLQAFPDAFRFAGTYIQQSHQVGNAVPPLLAEHIGRAILGSLS